MGFESPANVRSLVRDDTQRGVRIRQVPEKKVPDVGYSMLWLHSYTLLLLPLRHGHTDVFVSVRR